MGGGGGTKILLCLRHVPAIFRHPPSRRAIFSTTLAPADEYFSGFFCDIWALGVTLYVFIWARVPWTSNTNQFSLMDV